METAITHDAASGVVAVTWMVYMMLHIYTYVDIVASLLFS